MSLIKDTGRNDEIDFDQLFNEHFDYLVNFANQYVKDPYAAEDICQKVFIKLWENRSSIDSNKSIKSYLFTAVRSRCLNYIRDHQSRLNNTLDIDCAAFLQTDFSDLPAYNELKAIIEEGLKSLPESCQRTFYLSRFEGKKYKEIADELDISQKTVEAHMSKALKHLRLVLKDYLSLLLILISQMK